MTDHREGSDVQARRPLWRTPMLSEETIVDVTLFTIKASGADAGAASPGYSTLGNS